MVIAMTESLAIVHCLDILSQIAQCTVNPIRQPSPEFSPMWAALIAKLVLQLDWLYFEYTAFGDGHIMDIFYNFITIFVCLRYYLGILLSSVLVIHSHFTGSWLMM